LAAFSNKPIVELDFNTGAELMYRMLILCYPDYSSRKKEIKPLNSRISSRMGRYSKSPGVATTIVMV